MTVLVDYRVNPSARVWNSANITLADNVETTLTFDSEQLDPWGMHDPLVNPSRLTCIVPGTYLIGANVGFVASSVGQRYLVFVVNGVSRIAKTTFTSFGASGGPGLVLATLYPLNAGDYVTVAAYQNSGAPLDVTSTNPGQPVFWAAKFVS